MLLASFKESLAAARVNILPGLVLWVLSLLAVFVYYRVPAAQGFFTAIAGLKSSYGFGYSLVATALFGGVIPALLTLYLQPGMGIRLRSFMLFAVCAWGYRGMEVDFLYRMQSVMFGDAVTFLTILKKTLFDQFVYVVLWSAPTTVLVYLWKDCGFSWAATRKTLTAAYFARATVSMWVSTWIVWIPAVAVIYSLPPLLQVPLFNFVLCFFVCMITYLLGKKSAAPAASGAVPP